MKTKLIIFKEAAYTLSFTKAADKLNLSQPAVSKAIRTLEADYKATFFIRKRHALELTIQGRVFLNYADEILEVFERMENHFLDIDNDKPRHITFGLSSTLANHILPPIIAKFRSLNEQTKFRVMSGNTVEIEQLILDRQIDFGIIEGKNTHTKLQYNKFIKDEIVLVTNANNTSIPDSISKNQLADLPFISREDGSGTKEVIDDYLLKYNLPLLNTIVTLSSTEAIRNYLYHADNYALVSVYSIKDDLLNNKLKIVDISDFTIERWFYFVSRTGYQSKIMDYFQQLILNNHD